MNAELQEELDALECNLQGIRNKFLSEWMERDFKKLLTAKMERNNTMFKQKQDTIKDLRESLHHIQVMKSNEDKVENGKLISSLEEDLKLLSLQEEQLCKKKVLREKQLHETKKINLQEEQGLKNAKEKTALIMNQFTKGIDFFQNRLGLVFKKVDEEHLQFVFKYIDSKDPNTLCIFTMKVDGNGKYIVKDCSPSIDNLPSLIDELNDTNDLSKFVISVRCAFKKVLQKCD